MTSKTRCGFTAKYYTDLSTLHDNDGTKHWVTRAANFVVVATQVAPGTTLRRVHTVQKDEYMLLLPEDMSAEIEADGEIVESAGDSLTIMPPGNSIVTVSSVGWIYRIFSKNAKDLLEIAANTHDYVGSIPEVDELVSWPEPIGGYRLRHYKLSEYVRNDSTMRLFRSANLMVNIFLPNKAPRDIHKMTPHWHENFEQGSLALRGEWIHHMRYPWVPDMTTWREDEHEEISSPSLIIIPPKAVHTSQSLGKSGMRLVDIFSPPRDDFSLKPGLVCNADEYPLPERLHGVTAPTSTA